MFASLECDEVDSLVNETLPNWQFESAQNMMDFDLFFNIEEQEETECENDHYIPLLVIH